MQQLWLQVALASRPQRFGLISAASCWSQIAQLAATLRDAEPEQPQPQRKFHGIDKSQGEKNYRSLVHVSRSQVPLLPESLRRPGKDGSVMLHGGTYLKAEEAARATDK